MKIFIKGLVFAILSALFLVVNISGQDKALVPDTYAGKMMVRFLEAFNSGDSLAWQEFVMQFPSSGKDSVMAGRRLGLFRILYGDLGEIRLDSITTSEEYRLESIIQGMDPAEGEGWISFSMAFTPEPPHDWLRFGAMPIDDPKVKLPDKKPSDADLAVFLEKYLNDIAAKDKFSGTVLVARGDSILYKGVFGEACRRYHIANRLDTKFNLGSINKMFTGLAIAQLAEKGKLSFQDPIIKYLPDYPRPDIAEKVTIHQLLTHTSGTGDYFEALFDAPFWEIKTVRQLADLVINDSLLFEPGAQFHYSNVGPVILGLIIEKITGKDYFEYIRENIYQPAGMINTDCYEVDRDIENLAIGYTGRDYDGSRLGAWQRNNLFMHAVKGGPAGGGYSTVEDMWRFGRALLSGKLAGKAYVDTMITGKVEMGPDMKYGYLCGDELINGQRVVGHTGGAPGINAVFHLHLNSDYTVVVLSNYDQAALPVARLIDKILTRP